MAHACGGPERLGTTGPCDGSQATPTQDADQLRDSRSCACPRRRALRGEERHQHAVRARLPEFDLGIVGPGALATLAWLRGGEGTLPSLGFWQTAQAPAAVIARQGVARLAEMESCHWLDMQHALCLWRSSETVSYTHLTLPTIYSV